MLECRYCSCIRSVLVYAVPVFYYSLPMYLKTELERVQKRALAIIFPGMDYSDALAGTGLPSVERYNENTCKRTFNSILNDKVIGGSTKTVQHSIKNISRNIRAVFFKLGPRNVHRKRNRMAPTMLLPWQHSWLRSLCVKNQISPFAIF